MGKPVRVSEPDDDEDDDQQRRASEVTKHLVNNLPLDEQMEVWQEIIRIGRAFAKAEEPPGFGLATAKALRIVAASLEAVSEEETHGW